VFSQNKQIINTDSGTVNVPAALNRKKISFSWMYLKA